jgi:hypothetical protein
MNGHSIFHDMTACGIIGLWIEEKSRLDFMSELVHDEGNKLEAETV